MPTPDACRARHERAFYSSGVIARSRVHCDASQPHARRLPLLKDESIVLILEALKRCERLGGRHRQAALENNGMDLLRADGRREEAMVHLKRAVALFVEIGGRSGVLEPEIWKLVEW